MRHIDEALIVKAILYYYEDEAYMKTVDRLLNPDVVVEHKILDGLLKAREECLYRGAADFVTVLDQYSKSGRDPSEVIDFSDQLEQGNILLHRASVDNAVQKIIAKSNIKRWKASLVDYQKGIITQDDLASIITYGDVSGDEDIMTLAEAYERTERSAPRERVRTGFSCIDRTAGGLARGRVTIIAARPGVGKSDLALNIALNVANSNRKVFFASPEMDYYEIVSRAKRTIYDPCGLMGDMVIDSSPIQTVSRIAANSHRHKPDLVVVDHLQALSCRERGMTQYEKVTLMSEQLRISAKGHVEEAENAPAWLVLAQLSRMARTENERPVLADLRDSGAIEQDADAVIFLHEPDKREPGQESRRVQVTTAKNRGGYLSFGTLVFHMARSYWEPADEA